MMTKVTSSVDRTSGTTKRSHSWPSAVGEHVTPPEPTPVTKSTRASPTGSKWSDSSGVVGLPLESTGWAAISTTGLIVDRWSGSNRRGYPAKGNGVSRVRKCDFHPQRPGKKFLACADVPAREKPLLVLRWRVIRITRIVERYLYLRVGKNSRPLSHCTWPAN